MLQALELASPAQAESGDYVSSAHLLEALCRLNVRGCGAIRLESFNEIEAREPWAIGYGIPEGQRISAGSVQYGMYRTEQQLFDMALDLAGEAPTVGAVHFLQAIVKHTQLGGGTWVSRSVAADALVYLLTGDRKAAFTETTALQRLVKTLEQSPDGADDYQYVVALEGDRFVFRVVSTVDDFVEQNDTGLWLPHRGLLTHLGGIGLFTSDEIEELEELMNDPRAAEAQFQEFFERHPHFLRRWDHREVHPHVYLTREDDGPLVPDFILTNRETHDAAILDIKRTLQGPKKKSLIRRQHNRERFADAVQEACSQLRTYRRWFEVPENRKSLKAKIGMEVYNPRLMVVIGRSSEFRDEVDRAILRSGNPDVEIVTYDDMLRHARHRMVFIEGGR